MAKKSLLLIALSAILFIHTNAQDKGSFSGNLFTNFQKYVRDDKIGATTKVYKENSASLDAWLFTQYRIKGFTVTARFDMFNNSPLLNPQDAYTNHGIGYWQIDKKLEKLEITAGSFYDILGSGILFRAYEQRALGIDYAVQGLKLEYQLSPNWRVKGFGGNQKGNITNRFGFSPQFINGANIEGTIDVMEGKGGAFNLGASYLNRTLGRATVDELVAEINTYDVAKRFYPKNNVYGFNGYFTYSIGDFQWNTEVVYKTEEAIRMMDNKLEMHDGKVARTSLTWGLPKFKLGSQYASFGLNLQARHVDKFQLKTSPNEQLLNGLISYLPSLTRQNAYRLLARYNAPAQDLGENGIQGEIEFKPRKGTHITLNGSYVQSLNSNGINNKAILLFREYYAEVLQNLGERSKLKLGFQSVEYNQERYEIEAGYDNVVTMTPFFEFNYKSPKNRSIRIEGQYLSTKQDQGSFSNLIVEYFPVPKLSIALGDMVNVQPHRYDNMKGIIADEVLHYPSAFVTYTQGQTVYTCAFLKQQQGVNCSGGICRVEPAFSGFRISVRSSF